MNQMEMNQITIDLNQVTTIKELVWIHEIVARQVIGRRKKFTLKVEPEGKGNRIYHQDTNGNISNEQVFKKQEQGKEYIRTLIKYIKTF